MSVLRFGPCELLTGPRQLLIDGHPVALGSRAFDLLHYLARFPDRVVGKDELLDAVWPGVVVTENNLNVQVAALRRVLGAAALITVSGRGFRFGMKVTVVAVAEVPSLGRNSIAVLPFENLSGDPAHDYLGEGMAEDVITSLARSHQLVVVARNSSFVFKHSPVDVREVGRKLGVRYVLDGSLRIAGKSLRLTAQLIDAVQGTHLWAERFDGGWQDLFELQDAITARVVGAVEPAIRQSEIDQARCKRLDDLDAYDLLLRAMPYLNAMEPAANTQALALLQESLRRDPDYGPAMAYIAWCYAQRLVRQWSSADPSQLPVAIDMARHALHAGRNNANSLAYAGFVLVQLRGDVAAGLSALGRACEMNPNDVDVLCLAGTANVLSSSLDKGIFLLERARRFSPVDPSIYRTLTALAYGRHCEGDHSIALELATESLIFQESWTLTWLTIASAAVALNQTGRARDAIARIRLEYADFSASHPIFLAFNDLQRLGALLRNLRIAGLTD